MTSKEGGKSPRNKIRQRHAKTDAGRKATAERQNARRGQEAKQDNGGFWGLGQTRATNTDTAEFSGERCIARKSVALNQPCAHQPCARRASGDRAQQPTHGRHGGGRVASVIVGPPLPRTTRPTWYRACADRCLRQSHSEPMDWP